VPTEEQVALRYASDPGSARWTVRYTGSQRRRGEGATKHFEDFPPSTSILCVSGQEEMLVFTDAKENPIRRQRWNEIWNRAAQAAELPPGMTPHDLRHYYASLLIAKGASVKAVQMMLRHKTATETLNTYAHLWPEDNALVRRAVDAELGSIVGFGEHTAGGSGS
jgi:integrase